MGEEGHLREEWKGRACRSHGKWAFQVTLAFVPAVGVPHHPRTTPLSHCMDFWIISNTEIIILSLSTHAMVILCLSANLWISKDFKKVSLTIFFWVLSALVGCKRWGCLLRSQKAYATRAVQCTPPTPRPVRSAARRVVRQPTPVPEGRRGGAADLLWDPGADPMWTQVC